MGSRFLKIGIKPRNFVGKRLLLLGTISFGGLDSKPIENYTLDLNRCCIIGMEIL